MWPIIIFWEIGLWKILAVAGILGSVLALANALTFYYYKGDRNIPIGDTGKAHNWRCQHLFQLCLCNICEYLLFTNEGFYCDSCGICADQRCLKRADATLKCKPISVQNQPVVKHHLVMGNVPDGAICDVCNEECVVDEPSIIDFQCVWCDRAVHTSCLPLQRQECDLGKNRRFIIAPNNVVLDCRRSPVGSKLTIKEVTDPKIENWTPLFVLGNRKSGNNRGGDILSGFRRLLNAAQVVDLSDMSPAVLNEWATLLPASPACRPVVLAAGGDGTAAWLLTTLHAIKREIGVALLPLGTGNDLSRVLGWGSQEPKPFSAQSILDSIANARHVNLDRWSVKICGARQFGQFGRSSKLHYMYNYISVGVDAQVALDFHTTRQSPFYIVSSTIFNKLLYLVFGTQQVVERGCRNLERRLELYLDDELVELPNVESIVVLNIPSWGAGVDLWRVGQENGDDLAEQSFNDGKLEVVGIYSSFHIAQLQVGLSKPHIIGQAKTVKIKLKKKSPMQIDGEPWIQQPAEITVRLEDQAKVMTTLA